MDYIGEPISQLEHALQCARFARDAGEDDETVLAALFHDLGHMCVKAPTVREKLGIPFVEDMGSVGVKNHEEIGAAYLLKLGFSAKVAALVKGHVQAKRYLVWRDESYYKKLSPASKETLEYQGGPMSSSEAQAFEKSELFASILKMRTWDDKAKIENYTVPQLDTYEPVILSHLRRNAQVATQPTPSEAK